MRALLLLGVMVASGFLALMLWTTGGHFVAQGPDLYVVCQYARAMAEGHPFQYNAGDAPTAGSTSLLHTVLLALAHALGARGEGLVAFAVLLGAALYIASIVLAHRVATRLAGPREALLAGALVALGGPIVWGYLYGSDIALFLFLALLVLDRWLAFWGGGGAAGLAVAGSLLALARPEGLLLALGLGAVSLLRPGTRRERWLPWVPVAVGLLPLLGLRILTGAWLGSSMADKSLLSSYGPVHALDVATKYGVDVIRGLLLGLYPSEAPIGFSPGQAAFVFPPLGLLLVLLAALKAPSTLAVPLRGWLLLVATVFALVGPNTFMGVHFNRYLMWAFPGLLVVVAVGLGIATGLVAGQDLAFERGLFRAVAGLFLLLGLLSTGHFAAVYAELAGTTWRREVATAEWIRENLPPGVAIANEATSIEYLTGHRNLNLHGVTSPGFGGTPTPEKEAGTFEALDRLSDADRPPYLLLTRSRFEGSEILPRLVAGPPLFETVSLGDDLLLFRAQWDLLGRGTEPCLPATLAAIHGLEEVDRLDICDRQDERAHGYTYRSRQGELQLGGFVRIDDCRRGGETVAVADAGRVILGEERFRVQTRPGRDLVVVLRSHRRAEARALRAGGGIVAGLEVPSAGLIAHVDGHEVARIEWTNSDGWNEHLLRLPGEAVSGDTTELRFTGRYTTFHYWFFQAR